MSLEFSSFASAAASTLSIGAQFAEARRKLGVSLEEASRATHIRADKLSRIENDDLSCFAHPSYARMFLTDYAKYLGISVGEIRRWLPDSGGCGTEGYQYLQEIPCEQMRAKVEWQPRKRFFPAMAAAALVAVCGIASVQIWITMRNIDRLGLYRIPSEGRTALSVPDVRPDRALRDVSPVAPAPSDFAPEQSAPAPDFPAGSHVPSTDQASLILKGLPGQDEWVQ